MKNKGKYIIIGLVLLALIGPLVVEMVNHKEVKTNYKTAANAAEFFARADQEEVVMLVLGRKSCPYCESFKPVFDKLAGEYDIDIYYFDSDIYSPSEFSKLISKDYVIPKASSSNFIDGKASACTDSGEDSKISAGYATPLTLFISSGKSIDCLLGAVSEDDVIKSFEYHNITKK